MNFHLTLIGHYLYLSNHWREGGCTHFHTNTLFYGSQLFLDQNPFLPKNPQEHSINFSKISSNLLSRTSPYQILSTTTPLTQLFIQPFLSFSSFKITTQQSPTTQIKASTRKSSITSSEPNRTKNEGQVRFS